jgi:hypothetical protein
MLIEESIVCEPDIHALFEALAPIRSHSSFALYNARERETGMLVSIKEVSVGLYMAKISEEMLVYK